jgi:hypothetical protein
MTPEISNADLVPFALRRLGGSEGYVDVEDIFEELWKLAPARFRWRKYDYPDLKKTSKALRDFEEANPGLLLKTPDGLSRQLAVEGQKWLEERLPAYENEFARGAAVTSARRRDYAPLLEIERQPLLRRFVDAQGLPDVDRAEVAELLKAAPDSGAASLGKRLARLRAASRAAKRDQLYRFLTALEEAHPEWFREGEAT